LSKKTVAVIIASGNDYLIQVKGNQPTLLQAITEVVHQQTSISTVSAEERSRGRQERRTVAIFDAPTPLREEWTGLRRMIQVDRVVSHCGKTSETQSYYISSVGSDEAQVFADGVHGHWAIENRLHWVKDVIQHEDDSRIRLGNGVETLSIFKNVAMNICRELGFDSIKAAAIHFASHVKELCTYFRT
jgi:predicted transposase YbfD/YdcC